MSGLSLISRFSRLSLGVSKFSPVTVHIHTSPCLLAEPLKKKKRIDPALVRARQDRKKKKIEKQIRKLEKVARQLKPIEECEVSLTLLDARKDRERSLPALSHEERDRRISIQKEWSRYKHKSCLADVHMIDRIMCAQQKALDELRSESEGLYQEAIQIDSMLLPFKIEGPADTPPIKDYDSPDGLYEDVSKKWTSSM